MQNHHVLSNQLFKSFVNSHIDKVECSILSTPSKKSISCVLDISTAYNHKYSCAINIYNANGLRDNIKTNNFDEFLLSISEYELLNQLDMATLMALYDDLRRQITSKINKQV